MRVLVTAGNTRERIDDVRDWGNIFTGNTGYGIARALAEVGEVDLLTSNRQHLHEIQSRAASPHLLRGYPFTSHAELKAQLESKMSGPAYDAIFMTAAVSDYLPAGAFAVIVREPTDNAGEERWVVQNAQARKVKSTHEAIAFLGMRTEKLVDLFRSEWEFKGMLVKFKLEVGVGDEQLIEIGQSSRRASGADYLVANTLEMVDGERAGGYLLSDAGSEWVPRENLAGRLVDLVRSHVRPAHLTHG